MLNKWKEIRRRKKARRRREQAEIKTRRTRYGSTVVVLNEYGPPCPRCKQVTQVREHDGLTEKQKRAPFYYARWYLCMNSKCRTTLIMPEMFKVWNPPLTEPERQRLGLVLEQLGEAADLEQMSGPPPWE